MRERVCIFIRVILSRLIGSLWDPDITACKKNEKIVEVNFTTSPLGNRYMAFIQSNIVIGMSYVSEVHFSFISLRPTPPSTSRIVWIL